MVGLMRFFYISKNFVIFLSVNFFILSLLSCSGPQTVANETWTIVRLISKGEEIQSTPRTVEVRYCTSKEVKEINCSAGTAKNFSVNLGGVGELSGGLSAVAEAEGSIAIDSSIGTELGFDRNSGQTLILDTPEKGFIRQYKVVEKYSIVSGKAVAQSSTGREQEGDYIFQSSCDLTIVLEDDISCDGSNISQLPEPTDTPLPTYTPIPTPTPHPPTSTRLPRTDTPAPQPTSTPIPPPTPIPNTAPGSILEVGEWWISDGVWLRLRDVQWHSGGLYIGLEFQNQTDGTLAFEWSVYNNFTLVDNTGYEYKAWPNWGEQEIFSSYEQGKISETGYAWAASYVNNLNDNRLFNSAITSFTFSVSNFSRISNAKWIIRAPR